MRRKEWAAFSANDSIPTAAVRERVQIHNGDLVVPSRTSRLPIFNPINALKKSAICLLRSGLCWKRLENGPGLVPAIAVLEASDMGKLLDIISLHKGRIRNLFALCNVGLWGSSMEPPAVLALDGSKLRTAGPERDCERQTLPAMLFRADNAGVVQIEAHDQVHLAPKVCRFFNRYLDADSLRRVEFRKAVAYAAHRFRFEPPATPSLQDDIAAAIAIAQEAAGIACASDIGKMNDGIDSGAVDVALMADAYATLAFAYRYVVGFYANLPMGDLGKVAVRLLLQAEREHDPVLSVTKLPAPKYATTCDVFEPNQDLLASSLSFFVPLAVGRNGEAAISLEVVSRRLKDQILLIA